MLTRYRIRARYFYPRSPCGERQITKQHFNNLQYFYPRSPCGERQKEIHTILGGFYFYPRSPCGERPWSASKLGGISEFLSTLSLRRATWVLRKVPILGIISIHALLAESDCGCSGRCRYWGLFLSTLSLRRATSGR